MNILIFCYNNICYCVTASFISNSNTSISNEINYNEINNCTIKTNTDIIYTVALCIELIHALSLVLDDLLSRLCSEDEFLLGAGKGDKTQPPLNKASFFLAMVSSTFLILHLAIFICPLYLHQRLVSI